MVCRIVPPSLLIPLFCLVAGPGQTRQPSPPPAEAGLGLFLPREVSGWKATGKDRTFTPKTIFEYIDGGAEVYLAYGFRELQVRTYSRKGQPDITVELFDMGRSGDAYGVFSYEREGPDVGIGQDSEFQGTLLRFWKGHYFVAISAVKEDPLVRPSMLELGKATAKALEPPGKRPAILALLPSVGLRTQTIRYFHQPFCLAYHYPLSDQNILHLTDKTDGLLAEYDVDQAKVHLILVSYPDTGLAGSALRDCRELLSSEHRAGRVEVLDNLLVLAPDAPSEEVANGLIADVKQRARGE